MRPRRWAPPANRWVQRLRAALMGCDRLVKVMAIELEITPSAVSQLLGGGKPSIETMARAEKRFDIHASDWLEPPKLNEAPLTIVGSTPDDDERITSGERL